MEFYIELCCSRIDVCTEGRRCKIGHGRSFWSEGLEIGKAQRGAVENHILTHFSGRGVAYRHSSGDHLKKISIDSFIPKCSA